MQFIYHFFKTDDTVADIHTWNRRKYANFFTAWQKAFSVIGLNTTTTTTKKNKTKKPPCGITSTCTQ